MRTQFCSWILCVVLPATACWAQAGSLLEDPEYARERLDAHTVEVWQEPAFGALKHAGALMRQLSSELRPEDLEVLAVLKRVSGRALFLDRLGVVAPVFDELCADLGNVSVYESAITYRKAQMMDSEVLTRMAERELGRMSRDGSDRVLSAADDLLRGGPPKMRRDWPGLAVDVPQLVEASLKRTCINYYRLSSDEYSEQSARPLTPGSADASDPISQVAQLAGWPRARYHTVEMDSGLHIDILTSPGEVTSSGSASSVASSGAAPDIDCDAVQAVSLTCLFTWTDIVDIITYDTAIMGCALVRLHWPPDFTAISWSVPSTNLFMGCTATWSSNPTGYYRLDSFGALIQTGIPGPIVIYHPDTPVYDDVDGFLL